MSSEHRSSSGVRNLRSLFENKAGLDSANTSSSDSRGRSPSGVGGSDKENGGYRPTSKVRASFVAVEKVQSRGSMEGSAGLRRGSFSEADGEGALSELKKTISQQQQERLVPEGAVESAVATPLPRKAWEGQLGQAVEKEAANPDKPVTGAEEEPRKMQPADPASEAAVSKGEALPPVAEDLRTSTKASASSASKKPDAKKATTNGRPAAISTKAPPPKATSSNVKSPSSQPKTPTSTKGSTSKPDPPPSNAAKPLSKKVSRTSLAAPTAASMAHTRTSTEKSPSANTSPNYPKVKAREVTKPIDIPSHLTAPTASSRAKHEPDPAPTTSFKTSTASRPKQSSSAKAPPRASLPPRTESRDSHGSSARRSLAPAVDSGFLERMMKPTAASASRTHEKVEPKSPPKKTASTRLGGQVKVNGNASKHVPTAEMAEEAEVEAETEMEGAGHIQDVPEVLDEVEEEPIDEEPLPHSEEQTLPAELQTAANDDGPVEEDSGTLLDEPLAKNDTVPIPVALSDEPPVPHTNGDNVDADEAEQEPTTGAEKVDLEATPASLAVDGEEPMRQEINLLD